MDAAKSTPRRFNRRKVANYESPTAFLAIWFLGMSPDVVVLVQIMRTVLQDVNA